MANVVLANLSKTYVAAGGATTPVVHGIDLEIRDREFMVFVGPSGCGKSTTLRMIAGLEEISGGTVSIDGQVVNAVLPKDRDIAMVFQNYALYPHMTVYENMAFGLKLRKFSKAEIEARVREASAMLGLDALLDRKPKALSGGQRQRVAVGRAIVRKPKVFLFDEPLSNLDAKMRATTRTELAKLHARLGATMIYVTHDQVEAMTMGDRICVMKDGRIQQVAEPLTLYNRPVNLFVAGFIGSPAMNFFRGTVRRVAGGAEADDGVRVRVGGGVSGDEGLGVSVGARAGVKAGEIFEFVETTAAGTATGIVVALDARLAARVEAHAGAYLGKPLVLGVRPEDVQDTATLSAHDPVRTIEVTVEVSEPMGAETYLYLTTGMTAFIARVSPTDRFEAGQRVKVTLRLEHAHLFDAATELALG